MRGRRLSVFVVVACALHASAALYVGTLRDSSTRRAAPVPSTARHEVEIDVATDPSRSKTERSPEPVRAESRIALATPPRLHAETAPAPGQSSASPLLSAQVDEPIGRDPVAGAPSGAGSWSFNPVARPDLAFGRSGTLGPVASTVRPAPEPKSTLGITAALDARDHEIGMTRTGPLLAATEDAVREGRGPAEGKATFLVSIDREGTVLVTLENAEKESEAWTSLTSLIAEKAKRGKPVRIPPNARGLLARIEINAEIVMPDGQRLKDTERPAGLYATAGAVASAGVRPPDVGFQARGKVCSVRVSVATLSIGGGCSLENIGASPQRIVHGRIAEERRL